MKFSFPVFPDQASKMAANAVSSGRQLTDKCLPEYISTAMKTKDFLEEEVLETAQLGTTRKGGRSGKP